MPFNLEELVRSVLGLELGERRTALPPLKANQSIAGPQQPKGRPQKAIGGDLRPPIDLGHPRPLPGHRKPRKSPANGQQGHTEEES